MRLYLVQHGHALSAEQGMIDQGLPLAELVSFFST